MDPGGGENASGAIFDNIKNKGAKFSGMSYSGGHFFKKPTFWQQISIHI